MPILYLFGLVDESPYSYEMLGPNILNYLNFPIMGLNPIVLSSSTHKKKTSTAAPFVQLVAKTPYFVVARKSHGAFQGSGGGRKGRSLYNTASPVSNVGLSDIMVYQCLSAVSPLHGLLGSLLPFERGSGRMEKTGSLFWGSGISRSHFRILWRRRIHPQERSYRSQAIGSSTPPKESAQTL